MDQLRRSPPGWRGRASLRSTSWLQGRAGVGHFRNLRRRQGSRLTEPLQIRRGSTGPLLPGIEARIVDLATGADLGTGETGELLVRGPNVMKGYLNRPAENAGTLLAHGWMRTGDIASFDAEGFLYIIDRAKDLIKYNAYQIAPAELEAVL